jgi:hypothetical protein
MGSLLHGNPFNRKTLCAHAAIFWMQAPRCSALQVFSFGEGSFGALGEDFRGSPGGSSMGFLPSNAESDTLHKLDPVPKMLSGH